MLKKAFLAGLITMLLLSGTVGCGGAETAAEKEQIITPAEEKPAIPAPAPTPTSTPTPKPETTKSPEITGTVTLAPEAKGKIEITHQASVFSTLIKPVIEVTIKNIENEPIKIYHYARNEYGSLFYKIISKDKDEKALEEGTRLYVPAMYADSISLRPKEIKSYEAFLFPSDETRSYEIIVGYIEWPEITGQFVSKSEFSEIEAKLNISHRLEKRDGKVYVVGEVKAKELIEFKGLIEGDLHLKIAFKDVDGKVVNTPLQSPLFIGNRAQPFKAGQVKSFDFMIYKPEVVKVYDPESREIKSYELFLIDRYYKDGRAIER